MKFTALLLVLASVLLGFFFVPSRACHGMEFYDRKHGGAASNTYLLGSDLVVKNLRSTADFCELEKRGYIAEYFDEDTMLAIQRYVLKLSEKLEVSDSNVHQHGFMLGLVHGFHEGPGGGWYSRTDRSVGMRFAEMEKEPEASEGCTFTNAQVAPNYLTTSCEAGYYSICALAIVQPFATTYAPDKCHDEIVAGWRLKTVAYNAFSFRIRVIDLDTTVDEAPRVFAGPAPLSYYMSQTFPLRGLKQFTNYKIETMLCLTTCCCTTSNTANTKVFLQGGPLPVSFAEINHFSIDGECLVSWAVPDVQLDNDIQGFKVTLEAKPSVSVTPIDEDTVSEKHMVELEDNTLQYKFKTLPNRDYRAFVQVKACGRLSEKVQAAGECKADAEGPVFIPSPGLIIIDGKIIFRISVPGEDNGHVSCFFVIIRRLAIKTMTTMGGDYTPKQLRQASENEIIVNEERIAIAIPREDIEGDHIDVDMSKEIESECNIQGDGMTNNVYSGKHTGLDLQWFYSVYVVTSTARYDGAVLRKSASTLLAPYLHVQQEPLVPLEQTSAPLLGDPDQSVDSEQLLSLSDSEFQSLGSEDWVYSNAWNVSKINEVLESCSSMETIFSILFGTILAIELGVFALIVTLKRLKRCVRTSVGEDEDNDEEDEDEDIMQDEKSDERHKKKESKYDLKERKRDDQPEKDENRHHHHHRHHHH